ncbi:MAG: hypothetical protein AAGC55_21290 [Myxococcota bacterium]
MTSLINSLGSISVLDEHGGQVALTSLWREQPAILVFVRHFG